MKTAREILTETQRILRECVPLVPGFDIATVRVRVSNRMSRAAGKARILTRTIYLSVPFFADDENFRLHLRNTVTHELAHLLAPPVRIGRRRDVHGPAWRAMHRRLGGTGARCHEMEVAAEYAKAKRPPVRVPMPCPKCGKPMLLGKTQARRHADQIRYGGRGYTHRICPR